MDVEVQIRDYIRESFLLGGELSVHRSQSLLGAGVLDSTGVLELITFLEQQFGVQVADEEVIPENLDTLENMVRFVERKLCVANPLIAETQG